MRGQNKQTTIPVDSGSKLDEEIPPPLTNKPKRGCGRGKDKHTAIIVVDKDSLDKSDDDGPTPRKRRMRHGHPISVEEDYKTVMGKQIQDLIKQNDELMKSMLKHADDFKEIEKKRKAEATENSSLINALSKKVQANEKELLKEKQNTERLITKMNENAVPVLPDLPSKTVVDVSKKIDSNSERMQNQLHSDMKLITAQQFLSYCDFVDLQRDAKERMKVLYNSEH